MQNTQLQFNRVKRTLERHKSNEYPNIPRTILDILNEFKKPPILEKYGLSFDSDSKFYIDTVVTPNHAFSVFASQFVIDFIKKSISPETRCYVTDGTFDSLPEQFYQLLTITIEYKNNVSRCVGISKTILRETFLLLDFTRLNTANKNRIKSIKIKIICRLYI